MGFTRVGSTRTPCAGRVVQGRAVPTDRVRPKIKRRPDHLSSGARYVSARASLWAPLSLSDLDQACKALGEREGISTKEIQEGIGRWQRERAKSKVQKWIGRWATSLRIDAVIWTNLPPKFNDEDGRIPSAEQVISYLNKLTHEKRKHAERYIRMTPRQIDTEYRRKVEAEFGWTPVGSM